MGRKAIYAFGCGPGLSRVSSVSSEGPSLGSHTRRGQDAQSPNTPTHSHLSEHSASRYGIGPGHNCCHVSPSLLIRVRAEGFLTRGKGFPDRPLALLQHIAHCPGIGKGGVVGVPGAPSPSDPPGLFRGAPCPPGWASGLRLDMSLVLCSSFPSEGPALSAALPPGP